MIVSRILELIESKGISKSQFYRDTGLSNGFLDKVKDIGVSKLELILNAYPEVNMGWLITGLGDMYDLSPKVSGLVEEPKMQYQANTGGRSSIPLVFGYAVGGFGGDHFSLQESDVKEHYVIPKFRNKQVDFMIEVEGSSMYPKYNSGDIVACRIINESNFIQWNKTHVVATNDQGILIKRIRKANRDNYVTMHSDNKDFEPFDVCLDEISGIAIVVGLIRLE